MALLEYLSNGTQEALAWRDEAACKTKPTEIFYPERGEPAQAAKVVCWSCPVRLECLSYGLANHDEHGVWGGTTEKERRPLLRALSAGVALADVVTLIRPPRFGCGCSECRGIGARRLGKRVRATRTATSASRAS